MSAGILTVLLVVGPSAGAARAESRTPSGQVRAERVVRRAASLLSRHPAEVPPRLTVDASALLRDVALARAELSGRAAAEAAALLARPADGSDLTGLGISYATPSEHRCSRNVCVHWAPGDPSHAVPEEDDGAGGTFPGWGNDVPDVVDAAQIAFEIAWDRGVGGLGMRPPLDDLTSDHPGPDGRLDVYLADTGALGFYGYCTTDDPALWQSDARAVSAFCVLDNDFSADQFGGSPVEALRVTAAHEFFHALQYSYDVHEPRWLMEGTASWFEDEVFDGINANRRFLKWGPLRYPHVPLDLEGHDHFPYGTWIFWRYLSERFGAGVIAGMWEQAATGDGTEAVVAALAARGTTLDAVLAGFGVANLTYATSYSEGRSYVSVVGSVLPEVRVVGRRGGASWDHESVEHLSNVYLAFAPARKLSRDAVVTLRLASEHVTVTAVVGDEVRAVEVGAGGEATVTLPFSKRRVRRVFVVLSNSAVAPAPEGFGVSFRATAA